MKAWMRGWSAARQPPRPPRPRPCQRPPGGLQLRGGIHVHEQLLGIAVAPVVHIQIAGVEVGIDVEDTTAARLDELPIGVEGALAVDGAEGLQKIAVTGNEDVEARGSVRQFPQEPGSDEGHVAGQAYHPFGGGSQHRRVDTHRRAALSQGVVDHRQAETMKPGRLARHHEHVREQGSDAIPHPLQQSAALERSERFVLAHATRQTSGQQGQAHIRAVRLPEQRASRRRTVLDRPPNHLTHARSSPTHRRAP